MPCLCATHATPWVHSGVHGMAHLHTSLGLGPSLGPLDAAPASAPAGSTALGAGGNATPTELSAAAATAAPAGGNATPTELSAAGAAAARTRVSLPPKAGGPTPAMQCSAKQTRHAEDYERSSSPRRAHTRVSVCLCTGPVNPQPRPLVNAQSACDAKQNTRQKASDQRQARDVATTPELECHKPTPAQLHCAPVVDGLGSVE
jgi:hypothetical protein